MFCQLLLEKSFVIFIRWDFKVLSKMFFIVFEKTIQPLIVAKDDKKSVENLIKWQVIGLEWVVLQWFFPDLDGFQKLNVKWGTSAKFSLILMRKFVKNSMLNQKY